MNYLTKKRQQKGAIMLLKKFFLKSNQGTVLGAFKKTSEIKFQAYSHIIWPVSYLDYFRKWQTTPKKN